MPEDPPISSTTEISSEDSSQASVSRKEVEAEMQAVLQSSEFRGSKRCQDFLRFVVEETLNGLPNGLKERTIGIGVFGREATYDTNEDGTVRIKASEVRKRLSLYYAGTGKESEIRITLPPGGYVPSFSKIRTETASQSVATESRTSNDAEPSRHRWHTVIWPTALLILAIVSAILWPLLHPRATVLDRFWAPV